FDLQGVRTEILADTFPYTRSELCVYLQLTGHEGAASGWVKILDAQTDQELHGQSLPPIRFRGPLSVVQFAVRMRDCSFPVAGVYYVQLFFEEKLCCERFLQLREG